MIIIDFIDMTNRVDKLTMMEELELAMEEDKAKPQVGQLSDLGLVEMTRHRQGQALSEIFSKRCPHCQGNGYIMEDMKFASATSEGEYRAKAAKFNKSENNKPEELKELPMIQEEKLDIVEENPSIVAQENVKDIQEEKETKKKNSRKGKGKKVKEADVKSDDIAQTVLTGDAEIQPVIADDANKNKQEVVESLGAVEQPSQDVEKEEEPKTTKKTRRPNRNSQKRTRKTTKKNVEE